MTANATDYHEATEEDVEVIADETTYVDLEMDEAVAPEVFEIADFGDAVVPFVFDPWWSECAYIGFRAQDDHESFYNMVAVTLEIKYGANVVRTLATDEWCYTGTEYWTLWDGLDDYGMPVYGGLYDVVLTVRDYCDNETVGSSVVGVYQW